MIKFPNIKQACVNTYHNVFSLNFLIQTTKYWFVLIFTLFTIITVAMLFPEFGLKFQSTDKHLFFNSSVFLYFLYLIAVAELEFLSQVGFGKSFVGENK